MRAEASRLVVFMGRQELCGGPLGAIGAGCGGYPPPPPRPPRRGSPAPERSSRRGFPRASPPRITMPRLIVIVLPVPAKPTIPLPSAVAKPRPWPRAIWRPGLTVIPPVFPGPRRRNRPHLPRRRDAGIRRGAPAQPRRLRVARRPVSDPKRATTVTSQPAIIWRAAPETDCAADCVLLARVDGNGIEWLRNAFPRTIEGRRRALVARSRPPCCSCPRSQPEGRPHHPSRVRPGRSPIPCARRGPRRASGSATRCPWSASPKIVTTAVRSGRMAWPQTGHSAPGRESVVAAALDRRAPGGLHRPPAG